MGVKKRRGKFITACLMAMSVLSSALAVPAQAKVTSKTGINVALNDVDIKKGDTAKITSSIELGEDVLSLQGLYAYITLSRELTEEEEIKIAPPAGDMAFIYGATTDDPKKYEVMALEQYGTNLSDNSVKTEIFNITIQNVQKPVNIYFDFKGEHSYVKKGAVSIADAEPVQAGDLTSSTAHVTINGEKDAEVNPDVTGKGETYDKKDENDAIPTGVDTSDKKDSDKKDSDKKDSDKKDSDNKDSSKKDEKSQTPDTEGKGDSVKNKDEQTEKKDSSVSEEKSNTTENNTKNKATDDSNLTANEASNDNTAIATGKGQSDTTTTTTQTNTPKTDSTSKGNTATASTTGTDSTQKNSTGSTNNASGSGTSNTSTTSNSGSSTANTSTVTPNTGNSSIMMYAIVAAAIVGVLIIALVVSRARKH